MNDPTPRPAIPAQLRDFYRTLAAIAREQQKAERDRCREVVREADEIEREGPPPPQFRPGVEMIGGHTWIDATGWEV